MPKFTIIATENIHRKDIEQRAMHFFPKGFTIIEGAGFWGGVSEKSLLITLAGDAPEIDISMFCKEIKIMNKQECLMVVELPAEIKFI